MSSTGALLAVDQGTRDSISDAIGTGLLVIVSVACVVLVIAWLWSARAYIGWWLVAGAVVACAIGTGMWFDGGTIRWLISGSSGHSVAAY